MSPSFTTAFLPDDMLELFNNYIKTESKTGFQSKINYEDLDGNKTPLRTEKEIKEVIETKKCCCSK